MIEENQTYDVYYDREGDFLELSFGEPAEQGTTEEIEQGIFITRDITTREIKNIGILDFKKRIEVLRNILNRFSDEDYNYLIKLANGKNVNTLLNQSDREYPKKLLTKLLFKEPRFLYFIKNL